MPGKGSSSESLMEEEMEGEVNRERVSPVFSTKTLHQFQPVFTKLSLRKDIFWEREVGLLFLPYFLQLLGSLPRISSESADEGENWSALAKVMLRLVSPNDTGAEPTEHLAIDKKRKQLSIRRPQSVPENPSRNPNLSAVGFSAPKLFSFDALFTPEDDLLQLSATVLSDIVGVCLDGNDACALSFGHPNLGKSSVVLGSRRIQSGRFVESAGIFPCAISWLYKGISERNVKTGTRFSVRVSAAEVQDGVDEVKDLLETYAKDGEQKPNVVVRSAPIKDSVLQHLTELRATNPAIAGFYLDAATSRRTKVPTNHFLFTLHVYQYTVVETKTGRARVTGGRSRLHLLDLSGTNRGGRSSMTPSNIANVLVSIFSGSRHFQFRDRKLTRVLRECLSSFTCQLSVLGHVSMDVSALEETLTIVQLASRIHRMRRKKSKGSSGGSGSSGDDSRVRPPRNEEASSSSTTEPSSSELSSCDTVIYLGPAFDEVTDEDCPSEAVCDVQVPNLSEAENWQYPPDILANSRKSSLRRRRSTSSTREKAHPEFLRYPPRFHTSQQGGSLQASPRKCRAIVSAKPKKCSQSVPTTPVHRSRSYTRDSEHELKEQWVDGPRFSRSSISQGRRLKVRWMSQSQPMSSEGTPTKKPYGYMDTHKKSMIEQWVELQTKQINEKLTDLEIPESEVDETEELGDRSTITIPGMEISVSCQEESEVKSYDTSPQGADISTGAVDAPARGVLVADSYVQVTEEDIESSTGGYKTEFYENPLPESDQEGFAEKPDHPLRILSQESLSASVSASIGASDSHEQLENEEVEILGSTSLRSLTRRDQKSRTFSWTFQDLLASPGPQPSSKLFYSDLCGSLPRDFSLSTLRQPDGASNPNLVASPVSEQEKGTTSRLKNGRIRILSDESDILGFRRSVLGSCPASPSPLRRFLDESSLRNRDPLWEVLERGNNHWKPSPGRDLEAALLNGGLEKEKGKKTISKAQTLVTHLSTESR
ncbi:unnamed protein product [Cyprideis torosa]|uniref:Uncharacterized protein n=1 Tax=Cyprideis torosa TaxID=163714 RepID=A0A7R8W1A0_9CRUS|nr:unnamed protein product [Cyprideis torosa]CAG0880520.1 unnamed protein product [Cyprideis torosa]